MERLTKGTKEFLVVEVTDRLASINSLVGLNGVFDVRVRDSAAWALQNQPVVVGPNVMQALCLIDTGPLAVGTYELFLTFTEAPEQPRLGPFVFEIA